MKIYKSINEFNTLKSNLPALTLVPTMGNLHMGHISLIKAAKKVNNPVISTIYINKLQFNDKNDYLKYPKTLDDDIELLDKHGCDFLLIPDDSILKNILTIIYLQLQQLKKLQLLYDLLYETFSKIIMINKKNGNENIMLSNRSNKPP